MNRIMNAKTKKRRRLFGYVQFTIGLTVLIAIVFLLRLSLVTDYMYHSLVKDPQRTAPIGNVIVAPADGTVLYVKRVTDGVIPQMVKEGVSVPVAEHLKMNPVHPLRDGYLIGIYMNTHGVHVNRIPNNGVIKKQIIFNGPHMNMTQTELTIILTQLIPGLVTVKKAFGVSPYDIEDKADYILKSARETLVLQEERGTYIYIVRIADYYVGKILTWVEQGSPVRRGQKLGMITWGSQTDILIEASPKMEVKVNVGDYVYGGQTVLATY